MAAHRIVGMGKVVEIGPEEQSEIEKAARNYNWSAEKRHTVAHINAHANSLRLKGTTTTEQGVYDIKRDEAISWLARSDSVTGKPDASDYPMLAMEIERGGKTPSETAKTWLNNSNLQRSRYAAIDRARMDANTAVRAATTGEEITKALNTFIDTLNIPRIAADPTPPEESPNK